MPATIQKKVVSFCPTVRGAQIMSIEDYTPSEIAASWYSAEESDNISIRCGKLIRRMESNEASAFKKYCIRGLESHTTVGCAMKRMNRSTAVAAVLDAQARQWNENCNVDAQAIADAYKRATSSSQMWAQVMGNRDQAAAEAILFEKEEGEVRDHATAPAVLVTKSRGLAFLESPKQRSLRQVQETAGKLRKLSPAPAA